MSLKAKFWASRLEFKLGGWVLSLEGWNLSFEVRFWASRLDLRLEGVDGRRRRRRRRRRRNFPYV